MKITADVADGVFTLDGDRATLPHHRPGAGVGGHGRGATGSTRCSCRRARSRPRRRLYGPRWAMVRAFLAANPINAVEVDPPDAWLGIVAGGKAFTDVRQALRDLGLDDDGARTSRIRLLRLGMIHPLERDLLREFADGRRDRARRRGEVGVRRVRRSATPSTALPDAPAVLGVDGRRGRAARARGGRAHRRRAGRTAAPGARRAGGAGAAAARREPPALPLLPVGRTPYFCSGCPHNRSTVVPEGSVAGGGIGCHAMVALTGRPESEVTSITQMGGEGAQWIGQAPYTDAGHMFQNMGDGTFAHSGQLAVQACVAAGVSITYKLLYNRAVAMTGGQDAAGGLEVPALTRKLARRGRREDHRVRRRARALPRPPAAAGRGRPVAPRPTRRRAARARARPQASPC